MKTSCIAMLLGGIMLLAACTPAGLPAATPPPPATLETATAKPTATTQITSATTMPSLTTTPREVAGPTSVRTASAIPPADTPSATVVRPATATPIPSATAATSTPDVDIIVDNRDAGFATTGRWFAGDGGQAYDGDCQWAPRGVGNIAYFDPQLPAAGSYEVFGWWCGDPHHDQTTAAQVYIYPTQGRIVPFSVYVDIQQNAGQWVSLGTYYLETNASLSIGSNLRGNIVADAFRFVYRAPDDIGLTPTPAPTRVPWTNHPPGPLEQLAAGDLTARLGLVHWLYRYSPVVWTWEGDMDDCQVFARTGCSGQLHGWEVHVRYLDEIFPYHISSDYRYVHLQYPLAVEGRQTLYLMVTKGTWFMRIDRYPDDSWWASSSTFDPGAPAGSTPLDDATVTELHRLAEKYNTAQVQLNNGFKVSLYGLGRFVEFDADDAAAVERLINALLVTAVPLP